MALIGFGMKTGVLGLGEGFTTGVVGTEAEGPGDGVVVAGGVADGTLPVDGSTTGVGVPAVAGALGWVDTGCCVTVVVPVVPSLTPALTPPLPALTVTVALGNGRGTVTVSPCVLTGVGELVTVGVDADGDTAGAGLLAAGDGELEVPVGRLTVGTGTEMPTPPRFTFRLPA